MDEIIKSFLVNPETILQKKPFTRGGEYENHIDNNVDVDINQTIRAQVPSQNKYAIKQAQYLREYDPSLHDIHYNNSIPKFKVKIGKRYEDIKHVVVALPYQKNIHTKQCLHLCGNPMKFTLLNDNYDRLDYDSLSLEDKKNSINIEQKKLFLEFKEEWDYCNMNVTRDEAVRRQKDTGDVAVLFSRNKLGKLKSKVYSYKDGYVLLPHYDMYGELILFAFYYIDGISKQECLDVFDDTNAYSYVRNQNPNEIKDWVLVSTKNHGFPIIPIAYKRGYVAWEFAQSGIEMLEIISSIDATIKKRHGWGLLWMKGNMKDNTIKREAGNIVFNVSDPDSNADAKYLTPPKAEDIDKLEDKLWEQIQIASSTTFMLPKDIKMSGDVSGIAVKLSMLMDLELALQTANDYADFADKMAYLFAYGLGLEQGNPTKFTGLKIKAKFEVWMPENDMLKDTNLMALAGAKIISTETATEKCSESSSDEKERLLVQLIQESKLNKDAGGEQKQTEINKTEEVIRTNM